MNTSRHNKIVSGVTLFMFAFSTIVAPVSSVYAADLLTGNSGLTTGDGAATTNKAAYTTGNPAYTFNLANISNVIPAVIGCTGIVNKVKKAMTDTFDDTNTASILQDPKIGTGNYKAGYDDGSGDSLHTGDATFEAVDTADSRTQKNTASSADSDAKTKELDKQKTLREECLNGVAYALAKAELASITNKTVNWINSGFNGDPLFIRDRESYFKSLKDQTLQSLLGPLSSVTNSTIYPFGADFARSAILASKTTFLNKSRSTLTNSLKPGATTDSFATDFSQGGWNGWFSLTQNPQNNPLGFGILASQELADKTNAKQEDAKADLTQGDGFLSQKRCVEYAKVDSGTDLTTTSSKNYSVVSNDPNTRLTGFYINTNSVSLAIRYTAGETGTMAASITDASGNSKGAQTLGKTKKGENNLGTTFNSLSASSSYKIKFSYQPDAGSEKDIIVINITTTDKATGNQTPDKSTNTSTNSATTPECIRYETVTPGTVIADQLKVNLGSSVRQLELADSLNQSLSAVFEALMNQLVTQGLSSLSNTRSTITNGLGGAGSNKVYDTNGIDVTGSDPLGTGVNGAGLSVNKGSGWYNTGDTFDITKDLGDIYRLENNKKVLVKKGVITIQKDYITAVNESTKELPKILPALGELDYCIPGPNPAWKSIALPKVNDAIDAFANAVTSEGNIVLGGGKTSDGQQFLNTVVQGVPGASTIVGIVRLFTKAGSDRKEEDYQAALTDSLNKFEIFRKLNIEKLRDDYTTYADKMDQLYGPNSSMRNADPNNPWYLPMAESGLNLTKNILSYDASMPGVVSDYADQVNQANANIYKLQQIKKKVDAIVLAAKRRQMNDIRTGKIKLSPECANLAPVDMKVDPNLIVTGGLGTGTGGSPLGNNPNTGTVFASYKVDFTVSTKESLEDCGVSISANNTSTGTVGPWTWKVITTTGVQTIPQSKNMPPVKISSFYDTGKVIVRLVTTDIFGNPTNVDKSITIAKRSITLDGKACPKL